MKHIEIHNLSSRYGNLEILKDISLSVEKGNFIGIIGPNGSGKSTLLKCIYRIQPYQGKIHLDNREIREIKLKEYARSLSVVQQTHEFPFDLSVYDVVMMGRTPYKKFLEGDNAEDIRIVKKAIETVGLMGYEERRMSELSGGEKQRIILARVLAQETDTIILDEPTNHLDVKYTLHLMRTVKNLGCTVISAIHDINLAFIFCDYIFALKDGKIVKEGSPAIIDEALIQELYDVKAKIHCDESSGNKFAVFLE